MAPKQAAPRDSTATASKAPRARNSKAPPAPAQAPQQDGLVASETMQATPQRTPSHDEIAVRAYSLWAARGFQGGDPVNDWVEAERQLRGQAS